MVSKQGGLALTTPISLGIWPRWATEMVKLRVSVERRFRVEQDIESMRSRWNLSRMDNRREYRADIGAGAPVVSRAII
jgi:hypothetical protein